MILPCRWGEAGLPDFAGRVRFRRRFGLPRRLDPEEHVWVTFAGADTCVDVWLNQQFLGQHTGAEAFEFEVTGLLHERNELVVEVEAPQGNGGLWGEVALEVRRSAYLRGLRLWASFSGEAAHLHISGEVVGNAERPLELYVILDRSTVAYVTVEAGGRAFQVTSEALAADRWKSPGDGPAGCHTVRIELVDGASVWYTVDQAFNFACW
jgi:hypothetical protein